MTFVRRETTSIDDVRSSPGQSLSKSSPNRSPVTKACNSPGNESTDRILKPKLSFKVTAEKGSLSAMNMSLKVKKSTMSVLGASLQ